MSTHLGFPVGVVWAGEAKERTYSTLLVPGGWAAPFGAVQMNPVCPNIPCSLFPAVIPSQGQGRSSQMSPELSLSPALSDPTGPSLPLSTHASQRSDPMAPVSEGISRSLRGLWLRLGRAAGEDCSSLCERVRWPVLAPPATPRVGIGVWSFSFCFHFLRLLLSPRPATELVLRGSRSLRRRLRRPHPVALTAR